VTQRMDYKTTFLLGFGFLGVSPIWVLYNSYVPVFLQAGNPAFEQNQGTLGAPGLYVNGHHVHVVCDAG
jgi:hypothetical protein